MKATLQQEILPCSMLSTSAYAGDFVFSQQKTKPRRWLKNHGGNKVVGKNHKQRIKRRPPCRMLEARTGL